MSLIRKASRVAVASSVHGRVQRRQQGRWAAEQQWQQPGAHPVASTQAASPPPTATDRISQLKALGELRAAGVLSEAEFEAEKRKLLES